MSFALARGLRAAFFLFSGTAIVYAPACGHDHDEASGPTDAVYEGTATDEGLENLEGLSPTTDAARAPLVTAPANGAKLPSATAPTFTWKATPTSFAPSRRSVEPTKYAGASPFGPMRDARAHGTPMNGRAYLLVFQANGANVLRVFTTNTSYEPTAEKFSKLKDAKAPLTLTVSTASFDQNNVVQGSGPFVGEAVTFTLEP